MRVAALAGDDGVTASGLSSDLKATRAHMLHVLNDLEAQGFLRGTPAKGKRKPGIATVYCIHPVKVRIALDELAAWILGQDPPVSGIGKTVDEEGGLCC